MSDLIRSPPIPLALFDVDHKMRRSFALTVLRGSFGSGCCHAIQVVFCVVRFLDRMVLGSQQTHPLRVSVADGRVDVSVLRFAEVRGV